jgi:hypothetical protein
VSVRDAAVLDRTPSAMRPPLTGLTEMSVNTVLQWYS